MKPLIKWAGGKGEELKYIEHMLPQFDRYFEPFFGGGALFFELEPKNGYVNDIAPELMEFYKLLKEKNGKKKKFKEELYAYVKNWEKINEYIEHFGNSFISLYARYRANNIDKIQLEKEILILFKEKIIPFNGLFSNEFCINQEQLRISIQRNLVDRLIRLREKIDTESKFSDNEIIKNIETAFRSGFYLHFRSIMNRANSGQINISDEKRIANYYFVREFCYGGMFRFNDKGEFNVPYGGNDYNKKDFRKKVDYLLYADVGGLLDRTTVESIDFEKFLIKYTPTENDFIFFDPPYDTEFNEYEENAFTKVDQKRLAEVIKNTKAKFILIIKETPFIRSLYEGQRGIKIDSFDKLYRFGIKGRNEREVKHLVIHNINIQVQKQSQSKLLDVIAI